MNIVGTEYTISGKYLEIFFSGCKDNKKCKGKCHNQLIRDFEIGMEWKDYLPKLNNKIIDNLDLIDLLVITGGEPLDQDLEQLKIFINYMSRYKMPICIFTSYQFDVIPDDIKLLVDIIKCGEYNEDYKGIKDVKYFKLQSTNQELWVKKEKEWSKTDGKL
jgi:organic radical activating enzyme